jgi:hypothetical protein
MLNLFDDEGRARATHVYPWLPRQIEDGGETAYALPCVDADGGIVADHELVVSIFLHGNVSYAGVGLTRIKAGSTLYLT